MKKKRDIFGELTEGFAAVKEQREGKVTLRILKMESKPATRKTVSKAAQSPTLRRPC